MGQKSSAYNSQYKKELKCKKREREADVETNAITFQILRSHSSMQIRDITHAKLIGVMEFDASTSRGLRQQTMSQKGTKQS